MGEDWSIMLQIEKIRALLAAGDYDLSRHAFTRLVERNISREMIRCAGENAEIIEDYPDDKYSPSCLLLGFMLNGIPLHLQVSRAEEDRIKIITLYVPETSAWENFRVRRET